jgi:predicted nucleotide-binding protein
LTIESKKSEIMSVLQIAIDRDRDQYLSEILKKVKQFQLPTKETILEMARPKGAYMTRDTVVIGQKTRIPHHMSVAAEASAMEASISHTSYLADLARQAGSHLVRKESRNAKAKLVGTNVFIGHGASPLWRELKEFIEKRIKLPADEFNRVPVAGVTNTARLAEMLDAAAIGLLVMTGEDELQNGNLRARMNVVHEAGLFQGRLGFTRAIILLEEGCEQFSNIEGLGQIRFPKGNIKAAFEEIRQVLEREGLIGQ